MKLSVNTSSYKEILEWNFYKYSESEQERWLSNTWVSNKENFEEIIAIILRSTEDMMYYSGFILFAIFENYIIKIYY